jgi:uncharacterized membrane protein YfcA
MIIFIVCAFGGCGSIGSDHASDWFMGAVIGLVIYIGGRIGAWWHHG